LASTILENLPILYAVTLLLLGLMVGSFLNVVIYRAPLNLSLLRPPSTCPKCQTKIETRDNIPVLSWLLLRGKCRVCHKPISLRYPLVELANGLLWAWVGYRLAFLPYFPAQNVVLGLVSLAFVSAMIVTFLVDLDHQIILDEISLGGAAVAVAAAVAAPALHQADTFVRFAHHHPLLAIFLRGCPGWLQSLATAAAGSAAGLALSLAVYFLGQAAFKQQIKAAQELDPDIDSALGLGDVKLMACLGALLGPAGTLFTFFAGSVLGAVVGSARKLAAGDPQGDSGLAGLKNRWRTGESVIPFGPFLVVAALTYFFFYDTIQQLTRAFLLR
jgi:leader peptidase (prepilin peptidase)/N-methyltransferase